MMRLMGHAVRLTRPDGSSGVLALLRRHWALLVVCAGFLLAGALVLDDYGVGQDAVEQNRVGNAALKSLSGAGERAFDRLFFEHDRYYGPVFEVPLVLVERMLGLEDRRDVFLSRHALTHLFFLAGGVFSYLLVLRMFGNRLLALVGMVLFLLHPRLYAHSFYNTKDIPFLVMFMVSLYLMHRAFRRDTLGAFLLCGVGMGLLVNLRVMGIMLFAAMLALRALDVAFAGGAGERRRVLLTGGAFALAASLTYYATLPGIWSDPTQSVEVLRLFANHPHSENNLFRGEWLYSDDGPPLDYIPVWIGITTPPVVLLLAAIGAVWLLWRGARRPRDIWHGMFPRFGLLLLGLLVVPVIAIVVNGSNIYDEWRHVFFLCAPLALLAAAGIYWLWSITEQWWIRAGMYTLLGVCMAVTIMSMMRVHPLEDSYFNSFVDRTTPEYLVSQYSTDAWTQSHHGIMREIVEDHPGQNIFSTLGMNEDLFPEEDRKRIYDPAPVFMIGFYSDRPLSDRYYTSRLYNNTLYSFKGMHITPEDVEKIIRSSLSTKPIIHSPFFNIYLHENALVYINESCEDEQVGFFFLHIYPEIMPPYYPGERHNAEFINRDFRLYRSNIDRGMQCFSITFLPDIPIRNIYTGRKDGRWSTRFGFRIPDIAPEVLASDPVAVSLFTIHLDGNMLVYMRDECTYAESDALFYLHVFPVDSDDLDGPNRQYGFENRDFSLWENGNRVGGRCVAVVALPDYPVASVATGQHDQTGGKLWGVNFPVTPVDIDPASLSGDPVASSVYSVRHDDDRLIYLRDGCTEGDTAAMFFLHIVPVDGDDLPAARRQYGFDNRDFSFVTRGARMEDDCVAVVPLPGYPIASIRTGQYDETGDLWSVEFTLPDGE